MEEERALYRAILDAPHDDTARVVYADWLDENADRFPAVLARAERARAEFIRVQCALARRDADAELLARQKRLNFRCGGSGGGRSRCRCAPHRSTAGSCARGVRCARRSS